MESLQCKSFVARIVCIYFSPVIGEADAPWAACAVVVGWEVVVGGWVVVVLLVLLVLRVLLPALLVGRLNINAVKR